MRASLSLLVIVCLCADVRAQVINGDFEADAIIGPGQTLVGPGENKFLVVNPLKVQPIFGYAQNISGVPSWINTFTNQERDVGLRRTNFDGSGTSQFAFINNHERRLSQVTSMTVQPGGAYSADILIGFDAANKAGRFQLWAGTPSQSAGPTDTFTPTSVMLAEVSVGTPGWGGYVPDLVRSIGQWHPLHLDYTAPSSGAMIGQPLTISFLTSAGSTGPTFWDNASAVPEPVTLGLLAMAAPALLRRRRRQACLP